MEISSSGIPSNSIGDQTFETASSGELAGMVGAVRSVARSSAVNGPDVEGITVVRSQRHISRNASPYSKQSEETEIGTPANRGRTGHNATLSTGRTPPLVPYGQSQASVRVEVMNLVISELGEAVLAEMSSALDRMTMQRVDISTQSRQMLACCESLDALNRSVEMSKRRENEAWESEAQHFASEARTELVNAEVYANAVSLIGQRATEELMERDMKLFQSQHLCEYLRNRVNDTEQTAATVIVEARGRIAHNEHCFSKCESALAEVRTEMSCAKSVMGQQQAELSKWEGVKSVIPVAESRFQALSAEHDLLKAELAAEKSTANALRAETEAKNHHFEARERELQREVCRLTDELDQTRRVVLQSEKKLDETVRGIKVDYQTKENLLRQELELAQAEIERTREAPSKAPDPLGFQAPVLPAEEDPGAAAMRLIVDEQSKKID